MRVLPILIAVHTFLISASIVNCLTCLHCKAVLKPHYCTRVNHCQLGEVCSVVKGANEFGEEEYSLGCVSSQVCRNTSGLGNNAHCQTCCSTDLCNNKGCGDTGYVGKEPLTCYNCHDPTPAGRCHDIDICPDGEVCHVSGRTIVGEQLFTSRCLSTNICDDELSGGAAVIIGRRNLDKWSDSTSLCSKCCHNSLCNYNCTSATRTVFHGHWSDWSGWSVCSATCGNGTSTRRRSCIDKHCPGPSFETHTCDLTSCIVFHGHWSDWSEWSVCSATCGNGTSTRLRSCIDKHCPGPSFETHNCDLTSCIEVDVNDCLDVQKNVSNVSGVYTVTLWKTRRQVQIYCDMDTNGGGWTVFQRRFNGSVDFYRNFSEYDNGFGNLHGEFWLGLSITQEMVSKHPDSHLRLDLTAPDNTLGYDVYRNFSVGPKPGYRLSLGDRTNSLNMRDDTLTTMEAGNDFSTFDHDVDDYDYNCAVSWHGAWWYGNCYHANLNGRYVTPGSQDYHGMIHQGFVNFSGTSLKQSKMMFR